MQETRAWSLGWEDPQEKGMATHFSVLAWKIRHKWATNTHKITTTEVLLQKWINSIQVLQTFKISAEDLSNNTWSQTNMIHDGNTTQISLDEKRSLNLIQRIGYSILGYSIPYHDFFLIHWDNCRYVLVESYIWTEFNNELNIYSLSLSQLGKPLCFSPIT